MEKKEKIISHKKTLVRNTEVVRPQPKPKEKVPVKKQDVTKQLNFHYTDRVFKDLVPLDDSPKLLQNEPRKANIVNIVKKKDLEPKLEDFIDETPRPDRPIIVELPKVQLELKPKFDGRSFYRKQQTWSQDL